MFKSLALATEGYLTRFDGAYLVTGFRTPTMVQQTKLRFHCPLIRFRVTNN